MTSLLETKVLANTQNLLRLADAANRCGEYGCLSFLNPFHEEQIDAENDKAAKKARLQNKIKAAGRMALMLKNLRLGKDEGIKMDKIKSTDGKLNAKTDFLMYSN